MLRLIMGLVLLIALFAVFARLLPPAWAVPLYLLFLVVTVAFTMRERRRLSQRRDELKRDLLKERHSWDKEQARLRDRPVDEEE